VKEVSEERQALGFTSARKDIIQEFCICSPAPR
jgi:hypothetical protein